MVPYFLSFSFYPYRKTNSWSFSLTTWEAWAGRATGERFPLVRALGDVSRGRIHIRLPQNDHADICVQVNSTGFWTTKPGILKNKQVKPFSRFEKNEYIFTWGEWDNGAI